jgi:hypothetical protein
MVESVPIALQVPWRQSARIQSSDGTNIITIAHAGTTNAGLAPTKVFAVTAVNSDTIAHDVQIGVADASPLGFIVLGTVAVPISAGTLGTVPGVSLLSVPSLPLDETGQPYIFLNATDSLQVRLTAALSAGREMDIVVLGADF